MASMGKESTDRSAYPRRKVPVRYIDLRMAWQNYAREQLN